MIEVKINQAIAGVKAIVAVHGYDYVYTKKRVIEGAAPRCVYVYNGQPDCLVGKFLASQGVSIRDLERGDTAAFGSAAEDVLHDLARRGILGTDGETFQFLANLQYEQDRGTTWGEALSRATNVILLGD